MMTRLMMLSRIMTKKMMTVVVKKMMLKWFIRLKNMKGKGEITLAWVLLH